MEDYTDQITTYFEVVPLWPFLLLAIAGMVAFAFEIINRKRRDDAIENFRLTIETELASMYPKHIRWPENINRYLCSRLPEMQHNFEVLRVFIPQNQLRDYNAVWNEYCDFCLNITDDICAVNEQPTNNSSNKESLSRNNNPDPKETLHRLISDLLAFTEIK